MNKRPTILTLAILLFLLLTIINVLQLQVRVSEVSDENSLIKTTAMTTGVARLCINNPPENITWACPTTTPLRTRFVCQVTATDPEFNPITFSLKFLNSFAFFNITQNGLINFSVPIYSSGDYAIRVYADDNTGCNNSMIYQDINFSIIFSNSPPYLAQNIPNKTITAGTSYVMQLGAYFKDPDNDTLTYLAGGYNSSVIRISFTENSTIINALTCGTSFAFFLASDPFNETNTSNTVTYTVTGCNIVPPQPEGGGGGGGGGGETCTPSWKCGKWTKCSEDNQTQVECIDYNGCSIDHTRNVFYKNCTYVPLTRECLPKWNCTDWDPCINGLQNRICQDLSSCGNLSTIPSQQQECLLNASCYNGVQDAGENGIDCGGMCPACKETQKPGTVAGKNLTLLFSLIALLLVLAIIAYFYRKEIKKLWQKISKPFEMKKILLIDDKQKERLLQLLYIAQSRLEEEKYDQAIASITIYVREFFKVILKIEHINREIFMSKVQVLKNKYMIRLYVDVYGKAVRTSDQKPETVNKFEMQSFIDELLCDTYLVATFTEKDAIVAVKERDAETKNALESTYQSMSNIYIAIEFGEIKQAKMQYAELLKAYEGLDQPTKHAVFNDILRVYDVLKYLEDLSKNGQAQ